MKRVRVEELVDLAKLGRDERRPTPSELRAALPLGWVLDDDGEHAIRDRRVFFGRSWVLLTGLVMFGAAAIGLFATTLPRGWRGVTRAAILVGLLLVIGGLIGPLVTRALHRR